MLHLYYGRESVDAYAFFFSRFGPGRHAVIVPDQFTHQAEERAIEAFGSTGLMDTEIVSFTRLAHTIIGETGGNTRVPLTEDGRRMLLGKILREKEADLTAFRRMTRSPGFAAKLDAVISEFKQYGTSPEALAAAAADEGNPPLLRRKLADLAAVYAAYEEGIRGRFLDTEDGVRFTAAKAKDAPCVTDRTFWILGFDPFSPMIEELFAMLLVHAKDVHLAITSDPGHGPDRDLFRLSGYFAEKEKALARSLGVAVTEEEIPGTFARKRPAALAHLERELFRRKPAEWPEEAPEITFTRAADPYAEIEAAAAEICDLVRDGGCRYREIAVLTNDMEGRGKLAKRVFAEYATPVFLDEKKRILSDPAVVYVTALLDSAAEGRPEDVFRLLKTGFADIGEADREYLENYAIKYHIKGNAWKKPFRYGATERANHRLVYGEEGMARLNALRERVASLLTAFEASFGQAKTAAEKTRALYAFLTDEADLPSRIEALRDDLSARGKLEEAEELRQVWDAVTDVLEQLVELTADEEIAADDYKALLEAGLASKEIGLIPPAVDQLVIGPARRLATGDLRALFVIGANEGLFPAEGAEEDLLSSDERKALLAKDRMFCRDGGWIAEEETLAVYRDFAKPSERLWISCSAADATGEEAHEAELYTRLKALFPKNAERDGAISGIRSFETVRASLPHLAKAFSDELRNPSSNNDASDQTNGFAVWKEAYDWFLDHEPDAVSPVREGLLFRPGTDRIGRDTADRLYRKDVSPSRLERFSRCPFSHFVRYGLEPEELRAFEPDFRSAGDVYHEALLELSKHLSTTGVSVTDPASLWMTVGEEELETICGEILERVASSYREGLLGAGEAERYRKDRIGAVFFETAKALVRQVRTGTIEAMYLEEPFGRTAAHLPAIPVETSEGTYRIEGRIDRVDLLPSGFVKIIDYKSGADTFRPDDARSGWRLQLMLYLTAATQPAAGAETKGTVETTDRDAAEAAGPDGSAERTPAGALYFHVTDKDVDIADVDGSLSDVLGTGIEASVRKAFAMNGIVLNNAEVLESILGTDPPGETVESLRTKKDGSLTGAALIDETAFRALLDEVKANVTALVTEMFAGDVSADPKRYRNEDACRYCTYKAICRRN